MRTIGGNPERTEEVKEMHSVERVYIPTLPYPIRTRNVVRTVKKLKEKGYNYDEITIVAQAYDGYYAIEYDTELEQWTWEHVAVDPVIAGRYNILNARGSWGVLDSIEDVAKFIEDNAR